jgi:hypothetical protein
MAANVSSSPDVARLPPPPASLTAATLSLRANDDHPQRSPPPPPPACAASAAAPHLRGAPNPLFLDRHPHIPVSTVYAVARVRRPAARMGHSHLSTGRCCWAWGWGCWGCDILRLRRCGRRSFDSVCRLSHPLSSPVSHSSLPAPAAHLSRSLSFPDALPILPLRPPQPRRRRRRQRQAAHSTTAVVVRQWGRGRHRHRVRVRCHSSIRQQHTARPRPRRFRERHQHPQ